MRSTRVWAILTKSGKLRFADGRLPLYWMRKVAKRELWAGDSIVRVEVRLPDPPQKGDR